MKGYVLLQVLIFALLVAAISGMVVRFAMSRRVLSERHDTALQGRLAAETAHARAASCLAALGPACAVPASGCERACGVPCNRAFGAYTLRLSSRSFSMDVRVAGTAADCRIEVDCVDCPAPRHDP